jgi:peptidoglycan/xylan/chitin deacetylase (PgdA/CDA1 family)
MSATLPVLMYHGIHAAATDPGRFDAVYSVTPDAFERQLDWLVAHGYRGVRLRDVEGLDAAVKPVVITFDDGDVSNHDVALPLLLERRFAAEFFVTADFVGQTGMLSAAQTRALADAGMGVQSHGCTHRYLEDLDEAAMTSELSESKRRLEAITDVSVDALALPGGRGGARERMAALKLGFRHLLNSVPGPNRHRHDGNYLQRMAVTHDIDLDDFASLVRWSGVKPRWQRARFEMLTWPKRILGNRRYERWRSRVLGA